MQLQTSLGHASGAHYGGYLGVNLPTTHWAWSPGYEGDRQTDPRFVTTSHAVRDSFASLEDAVAAARRVSAGDRHAVAVVRHDDPNGAATSTFTVDQLLVQPFDRHTGYHPIDLESGGVQRRTYPGASDVWQPLQAQRQVLVDAIVDGTLVLDHVDRYQSTRP